MDYIRIVLKLHRINMFSCIKINSLLLFKVVIKGILFQLKKKHVAAITVGY